VSREGAKDDQRFGSGSHQTPAAAEKQSGPTCQRERESQNPAGSIARQGKNIILYVSLYSRMNSCMSMLMLFMCFDFQEGDGELKQGTSV